MIPPDLEETQEIARVSFERSPNVPRGWSGEPAHKGPFYDALEETQEVWAAPLYQGVYHRWHQADMRWRRAPELSEMTK